MILKEENVIQIDGDIAEERFESKINKEKLSKLYGMLSGLYRNVPGSIIREYCSNAVDAMKEAGKEDEPIYVYLHRETENSYLLIKDTGVGMSPDTMKNIYFNYLDSTKELSDDFIGSFGIGGKVALAYTHTFYIDTIFDGILYHYIFTKQSNGIPVGELLFSEFTEECNGTSIKVPIKNGDESTFYNEFTKQLTYFPQVYIDSNYYSTLKNDYKIYEDTLFKYRPNQSIKSLHISLGNVPYTIDWSELGRTSIEIPIALTFQIGELIPTPSRESIIYSKETIKLINERIGTVVQELTNKLNITIKGVNSIAEYIKIHNKSRSYINIELFPNIFLNVNKIYLPDLNKITISSLNGLISSKTVAENWAADWSLSDFYVDYYTGYKKSLSVNSWNSTEREVFSKINYGYRLYRYTKIEHKKNLYLADRILGSHAMFIKKNKLSLNNYIKKLELHKINKKHWREVITTFQKLSDEYINSISNDYDAIVVPDDWTPPNSQNNSVDIKDIFAQRKAEKKVVCYRPVRGSHQPFIWNKDEIKTTELCKLSHNVIYVDNNNKDTAMEFYRILYEIGMAKTWTVTALAPTHHKHLKDKPNCYEYNEFLKSKHKLLIQIGTAREVLMRVNAINAYFKKESFQYLNKDFYDTMQYLKDFSSKYAKDSWSSPRTLYNQIKNSVIENEIINTNIIRQLEYVEEYVKELKDMNSYIDLRDYNINFNNLKYCSLVLKFHKRKIENYWYLKNEFNPVWLKFNKEEDEGNI